MLTIWQIVNHTCWVWKGRGTSGEILLVYNLYLIKSLEVKPQKVLMTETGSYLSLREPGVTEEAWNFSDAIVAAIFLWNISKSSLFSFVLKLLLQVFTKWKCFIFVWHKARKVFLKKICHITKSWLFPDPSALPLSEKSKLLWYGTILSL